jgi:hypothetical protein
VFEVVRRYNLEPVPDLRYAQVADSLGIEVVFRCYSSSPKRVLDVDPAKKATVGSRQYGNCFFVPKVSPDGGITNVVDGDRKRRWTWTYLESQLNAWFWDNEYERVAMYQLHPNVEYHIGPVGQDTLAPAPHRDARTGQQVSHQRHLSWPGVQSELLQVVLVLGNRKPQSVLTHIDDWAVPGAPRWGSA